MKPITISVPAGLAVALRRGLLVLVGLWLPDLVPYLQALGL